MEEVRNRYSYNICKVRAFLCLLKENSLYFSFVSLLFFFCLMKNKCTYRNVFLQICFCLVSISLLEWRNCLMHIQDSVPFSEHCIIMCLGKQKNIFSRNKIPFPFRFCYSLCFSSTVRYRYHWNAIHLIFATDSQSIEATQRSSRSLQGNYHNAKV